jgi:hypothetical protein
VQNILLCVAVPGRLVACLSGTAVSPVGVQPETRAGRLKYRGE